MTTDIQLDRILAACSDDSADAAIRIQTSLEPIGGPGAPVKPAVYDGGRYQQDKRWESVEAEAPTDVIVIDNVPSQANRLEAAIQRHVAERGLPELVLDLGEVAGLPAHLPRSLSSWQFPHRNADAYLRDAEVDGVAFPNTEPHRPSSTRAVSWRCTINRCTAASSSPRPEAPSREASRST